MKPTIPAPYTYTAAPVKFEQLRGFWQDIFQIGSTVFQGDSSMVATEQFAAELVDNFERLQNDGMRVPILRQHVDEGVEYGEVTAMRINRGPDGIAWVQGLNVLTDPELREAYNNNMVREWSPGFDQDYTHPHTGESMGAVLGEFSFVSRPQQINLRDPHTINPGVTLARQSTGENHMGMFSKFGEVKANKAQFAAHPEDPPSPNEDPIAKLTQQIDGIQQQLSDHGEQLARLAQDTEASFNRFADEAEEQFARFAKDETGSDVGNPVDPVSGPVNPPVPAQSPPPQLAAVAVNPADENAPSLEAMRAQLAAMEENLARFADATPEEQQFAGDSLPTEKKFARGSAQDIVARFEAGGAKRSDGSLGIQLNNTYGPARAAELLKQTRAA